MHSEYAIEPEAIASDWRNCRIIADLMGYDAGRLVSRFPKEWLQFALETARNPEDERERKRIIEKIIQLKSRTLVPSGRNYGPSKAWVDNAIARHGNEPFRAVVVNEKQDDHDFVVPVDDVDRDHPLFAVPASRGVGRDPESLSESMGALLRNASRILFVDPHFGTFDDAYLRTLRSCLKLVSADCEVVCEVHHSNVKRCMSIEKIEKQVVPRLSDVVHRQTRLVICRWKVRKGGEDFHDRRLLTNRGGVAIGQGFRSAEAHRTTDMSLMDADHCRSIIDRFDTDAGACDIVEPVLEMGWADGSLRCRRR